MNRYISKFLLLIIVLISSMSIQAHEAGQDPSPVYYYMAGDANGVQQVFQKMLSEDSEARQLTQSTTGVIRFGVGYDAMAVVYISDGQLWLQSMHTEEAVSLTTINGFEFWTSPIFSQDGAYVAYEDKGVWLYDLANRQTRQILEDVPLAETASNADEYRVFKPQSFVANEDGTVTKLIVEVGKWEWSSAGVYDLETGTLLELEGSQHSALLPLSDGRVLVYGNSGVGGEGSLHIADSLATINDAELLVLFHELTEGTLFAEQAVEIESGVVRVFGSAVTLTQSPDQSLHFYFDVDTNTAEIRGDVQFISLAESAPVQDVYADKLELSPDGNLLPLYLNPRFADANIVYGELNILNFVTGEIITPETPEFVSAFQFQPR